MPAKRPRLVPIILAVILGLALALRLGFTAYVQPEPVSDFKAYWDMALDLAHGKGYVAHGPGYARSGVPSAYRPIGYPLLLSVVVRLFGESWWVAATFQVLVSTAVVAATYWLTSRLFGIPAALVAAALTAVSPDHVLWSSVLASEVAFMLWMLLGVTLWLVPRGGDRVPGPEPPARPAEGMAPGEGTGGHGRRTGSRHPAVPPFRTLLASGLFLGLGALTRPVLLPAPGIYFLYAVLCHRRGWLSFAAWRRVAGGTAAVALGMLLVIAPWAVRNFIALGAFVPVSTNGGVNLWQGNNPHANGEFFWSSDPEINPLVTVDDEVERDRLGRELALRWIREHPRDFIRLGFQKWEYLLTDTHSAPYVTLGQATRPVPPQLAGRVHQWLRWGLNALLTLAGLGLVTWLARGLWGGGFHDRAGAATRDGFLARTSVPLLFILFMLALHFVFPAWDRFRLPFTPFLLALSGLAVAAPIEALYSAWIRARARRKAGPDPAPNRAPARGPGGRTMSTDY